MGIIEFKDRVEAEAAGYERAGKRILAQRHFDNAIMLVRSVDTSPANQYGYEYSIQSSLEWLDGSCRFDVSDTLAMSVTVFMCRELNAGGSKGGYAQMYRPGDVDKASARALVWAKRLLEVE
jgi:hypothetical protein